MEVYKNVLQDELHKILKTMQKIMVKKNAQMILIQFKA